MYTTCHTTRKLVLVGLLRIFDTGVMIMMMMMLMALQQILSHIDLFLYWTDYTDSWTIYDFTLLNGCTGKCVRL